MIEINGTIVHPGDLIGFVSDVRQHGEILTIDGDWLTLKSTDPNGFKGEKIGGRQTVTIHVSDTWLAKK